MRYSGPVNPKGGVAGVRANATSSGDDGGFLSCLMCEVLCVGKGFWI
jgi:hypothetical protein